MIDALAVKDSGAVARSGQQPVRLGGVGPESDLRNRAAWA